MKKAVALFIATLVVAIYVVVNQTTTRDIAKFFKGNDKKIENIVEEKKTEVGNEMNNLMGLDALDL